MTYNLSDYRHNVKPVVERYLKDYPHHAISPSLSTLAQMTSCPIVIVAHYVLEIQGENEPLRKVIKQLEHFYKVEHIEGKL